MRQRPSGMPANGAACSAKRPQIEITVCVRHPLISRNGDQVADMFYTCNFAFFAMNEAYHATGKYKDAVTKLGDFLVKIQAQSTAHPDIDGAWMRAFDYSRWNYWASNADHGWGAWPTLSGWIQS